jgi:Tfp pilus assembly protein PilF
MPQSNDFPVLTRSQRISPKVLTVLNRINTRMVRQTRATEQLLAELGESELLSLPKAVEEMCGPAHPELAKVLHKIAVMYHASYSPAKAELAYRKAVTCAETAFPLPSLEMGLLLNNYGRLLHEQRRMSEAEKLYDRALNVLKQAVGSSHGKLATPLSNLADLYMEQGKLEDSKTLLRAMIGVLERSLGPNHRKVVKARERLSAVLQMS